MPEERNVGRFHRGNTASALSDRQVQIPAVFDERQQ
jgi:hypothetical protein